MMRIVLFADSRWRDSFGLALVRYWLTEMNPDAEVYVPPFDLWQVSLEGIKPDAVVLNHAFGQRNKEILKWARMNGATSFLMFTEGRPNTDEQVEWYKGQAGKSDYILSWSNWLSSFFDNSVTTGCPRFDIYQEPYRKLIRPKWFVLDQYGLDPNKETCLVTTSFPQAKFAHRNVKFNQADWKDLNVTSINDRKDPLLFAQREVKERIKFKNFIASQLDSDEINVIVKPHPMEDMADWQKYCDENGYHLIQHEYIFNLINASDTIFNRMGCLTSQDSWLMAKSANQFFDETMTGASLEAYNALSEDDRLQFLGKYGFFEENAGQKVASAILANTKEVNIPRSFNDLSKYQVAQANYDNQNAYPSLNLMHPYKAVTSNVIKNWELEIRGLIE